MLTALENVFNGGAVQDEDLLMAEEVCLLLRLLHTNEANFIHDLYQVIPPAAPAPDPTPTAGPSTRCILPLPSRHLPQHSISIPSAGNQALT